jgi:hypothetical protein
VREVRAVDLVHRREIVHVRQKHRGADDIREGEAAGLQERADVVEHPARHRRDVAVNQVAG